MMICELNKGAFRYVKDIKQVHSKKKFDCNKNVLALDMMRAVISVRSRSSAGRPFFPIEMFQYLICCSRRISVRMSHDKYNSQF